MPTDEDLIKDILSKGQAQSGTPEVVQGMQASTPPQGPVSREQGLAVSGGVPVAPGEINDPTLRYRAGTPTSDETVEKMLRIMHSLDLQPDDVLAVPDPSDPAMQKPPVILVRPKGSKDYVQFDSPDLTTVSDFADAAAGVLNPETIFSTLGVMMTGGSGLVSRAASAGMGAVFGHGLESEAGVLGGTEQSSQGQILKNALVHGGYAMAGEGMMEPISALSNVARGTMGSIPPGVRQVVGDVRAYNETLPETERLIGPTPMDIYPLTSRIAGQAASLQPGQRAFQVSRLSRVFSDIDRNRAMIDPGSIPSDELRAITDQQSREIEAGAREGLGVYGVRDFLQTAGAARSGLGKWMKARNQLADEAYADTRRLSLEQNVQFRPGAVRQEVQEILAGVQEPRRNTAGNPDLSLPALQVSGLHPRLADEINTFLQFGDTMSNNVLRAPGKPDVPTNAFESLKTIRTNVQTLLYTDVLQGQDKKVAAEFLQQVQKVIDNPVGGNAEFTKSLNRSNGIWRGTQKTMDYLQVREELETLGRNPELAGRQLISAAEADKARIMKAMIGQTEDTTAPGSNWQRMKQGYMATLAENSSSIPKELEKWESTKDKGSWFLDEGDKKAMRGWFRHKEGQRYGPIQKAIEEQAQLGPPAFDAMLSGGGSLSQIEDIIKRSPGGKEGRIGRAYRAGVIREILHRSSDLELTQEIVNPEKLRTVIEHLKRQGTLSAVLTPQEVKHIDLLVNLSSIIKESARVGAGTDLITAGTAQSAVRGIFDMNIMKQVVEKVLVNARIASIFNSEMARNRMSGEIAGKDISALRRLGWAKPAGIWLGLAVAQEREKALGDYGEDALPNARATINLRQSVTPPSLQVR